MTNQFNTLVALLLTLTIPQRRALGAHLIAFAMSGPRIIGGIAVAQAQDIAARLRLPVSVNPQDMAVLQAAVYLAPARELIPTLTLRCLERAWTKLGWTWAWPELNQPLINGRTVCERAEEQIRAILNPPPAPPKHDGFAVQSGTAVTDLCGTTVKAFLPQALIVIDDPGEPTTPEQKEAARAWFMKTFAHRNADSLRLGTLIHNAIEQARTAPIEPCKVTASPDYPERGSCWIRTADPFRFRFRIVDTGTGSIHWAQIDGPDRGQITKQYWDELIDDVVIKPCIPPTVPNTPEGENTPQPPDLDWNK